LRKHKHLQTQGSAEHLPVCACALPDFVHAAFAVMINACAVPLQATLHCSIFFFAGQLYFLVSMVRDGLAPSSRSL
jgi:hypothetical protein